MEQLEVELRFSVIRSELAKLATMLEPRAKKIVTYAVRILGLLEEARR